MLTIVVSSYDYLHSNMVRLKVICSSLLSLIYIYLHSNMVRLKVEFNDKEKETVRNLHSNMVRLKGWRNIFKSHDR